MADTYTPNLAMVLQANGDTGWGAVLNSNYSLIDAVAPVGQLAVSIADRPTSASLNVRVGAGYYKLQSGSTVNYAGTSSYAITANTTAYLWIDVASGNLMSSTSGFPTTTAAIPLASCVTGSTMVNSITDRRIAFHPTGPILDGTVLALGTTTGYQIGSTTSQRFGVFTTTSAQQSGGALTASSAYGTVEQAMLSRAFNCLRSFGFLS
jgi:hypothetical protein